MTYEEKRYIPMSARYRGRCADCRIDIEVDDPIVWDSVERVTYCEDCGRERKQEEED